MKITVEFDSHHQMVAWARDLLGQGNPTQPGPAPDIVKDPIEVLELTVRSTNCLKAVGMYRVSDVVRELAKGDKRFLNAVPNLGVKGLENLQWQLLSYQQKGTST